MKFISQFADIATQSNLLTDGECQCTYQDIPSIFAKLKNHFKNIRTEDCLAFECDNSVSSALTILYLLEESYSFLLLPKALKKQTIPKFCRYLLKIENTSKELDPEQFLSIFANENYNKLKNNGQKLYLRTSGSTGTPKMAVHSHSKLRENALNCVSRLELTNDDRIAIPVPLFHMYGLGAAFLPSIAAGASIDLQKGANLLRYLQREKEFKPNVIFMTPIFCETLLQGLRSPRTYRLTVTAGDRFRGATFTKYEALCGNLVQLYGSTEMGAIASGHPSIPSTIRSQTVGKPMQNVQMRIEPNGTEDFGELWCSHQSGFVGYVDDNGNQISLGQEYKAGWFRTKDFGRVWQDGYIEVLGRCDHSVNRDGLLVFFADVEKAIETVKGIDSAVVISKGESQRGKNLIAYCVPSKYIKITEKDIKTACFELLSKHAIPDQIILIDSLPLLANGKVDRQKLINLDN